MAVTSMLDYWDEDQGTEGGWNQIALSNLVEVEYVDEVYKPARIRAKIQNAQAAGGQAQTGVSHNGGTPLTVSKSNHGLHTGNRISVRNESTSTLEQRAYLVTYVDDDNFTLKHFGSDPLTGVRHSGSDLNAVAGNGTSGTIAYVPLGEYSVETPEIANPDFYLGQKVVLWQVPETFSKSAGLSHDGNATLITVTHSSHPFVHNDIVQFVDESTGAIEDREYKISYINSNSYNLRSTLNSNYIGGNGTAGTISTYFETKTVGYPIFSGTVTTLHEDWNGTYGKTITLDAKDNLQFLANQTAQKIIKDVSKGNQMGDIPRIKPDADDLIYLGTVAQGTPATENKFSEAVKRIVDDFQEGGNTIHTDNTNNGSTAFDSDGKKLEDSSFVLTANELASGAFVKNLSDTNFKLLKILRQLAMSDRHTSTGLNGTASYGTGSPISMNTVAHGLVHNQLIAVTGDRNGSHVHNDPVVVRNGIYRVRDVTANSFTLYTVEAVATPATGVTGYVDWEGVEDGNFGYDFFLDSGVYGQPGQTGMSVAGGTEIPYRPHLNYFKRGYRQFRPDATGLNVTLPVDEDAVETGQIRIMYPDANYKIGGEEETITAIDLQSSNDGEGDKDFRGSLGHRQELMRIKHIACIDNVASLTDSSDRQDFAGRWLGQFHWGRHDSLAAKTGLKSLPGMNDEPMLFDTGGTTPLEDGDDDASFWVGARSDTGNTYEDLVNTRIFRGATNGNNGIGGIALTQISGYGAKVSGFGGLSELPLGGRIISHGPGTSGYKKQRGEDDSVAVAATGVVDCDLIKSLKNTHNEKLYGDTSVGSVTSTNVTDLKVNKVGHGLLTGAWIKITDGTLLHASNYWKNYFRVEYINPDRFYLTRLPYEAYIDIPSHGMTKEDIYVSGARIQYSEGTVTNYRKVFNVFDGVCRVQYQTMNTRTEDAFDDNFIIISDRIRSDVPHMSLETNGISGRVGTGTSLATVPYAPITMPDSTLYVGKISDSLEQEEATSSDGISNDTVKVRFRKGDKVSETRFISHTNDGASTIHYFKNTQAIISENFMFDKNRNTSQELNYSFQGSDMNEVRRTAASFLTRSSRSTVRGNVRIVRFPFIKLTGQALGGTTTTFLKPTQNVLEYGGRPGMLVTKTDSSDGTFVAGVLAENISTNGITGTLSGGDTWAVDDWYRVYIHLRAGHSIRLDDARSSIQANMVITKIEFREGPGISQCDLEVIGLKDVAVGFAVKPIGTIMGALDKGKQPGAISPLSIGKARLDGIVFSSGDL